MSDFWISALVGSYALARHPRLVWRFIRRSRRMLDVGVPRDYFNCLQWRKMFDRNPLFVIFCDKLATKAYVKRKCPDLAVPEVLWTGSSIEDAPAGTLSGNVVVKANHGCDFNFFIRDGVYDPATLTRRTRAWMASSFGTRNSEWAYGEVARTLFVEEMLLPAHGPLIEINIRAGGGRIAYGTVLLYAKTPRQSVIYVDEDRRRFRIVCGEGVSAEYLETIAMPAGYDDAVRWALTMSEDVDYARYDFFWCNDRLFAGEVTVYPASGYGDADAAVERRIEQAWDLNASWFMSAPLTGWRARYRDWLKERLARKAA